jgi:hypothetical protein
LVLIDELLAEAMLRMQGDVAKAKADAAAAKADVAKEHRWRIR